MLGDLAKGGTTYSPCLRRKSMEIGWARCTKGCTKSAWRCPSTGQGRRRTCAVTCGMSNEGGCMTPVPRRDGKHRVGILLYMRFDQPPQPAPSDLRVAQTHFRKSFPRCSDEKNPYRRAPRNHRWDRIASSRLLQGLSKDTNSIFTPSHALSITPTYLQKRK